VKRLQVNTFSFLHPRDQIVAIMERIYMHEMTTTSGGNISVRDESGNVWITPARIDKGNLGRQDIVRISPGGQWEGRRPPSSENPFHLSLYEVKSDLQAVIHAHPGALVSFSICGQVPDTRLFPEAWHVCGQVAFAPYALPGSAKLGARIAEQCGSEAKPNCVLLENHGEEVATVVGPKNPVALLENNGVLVAGRSVLDAFDRLEVLEATAAAIIRSRALGPISPMGEEVIEELLGAFSGV
jgi:L-fuculose-phosphate aldolase